MTNENSNNAKKSRLPLIISLVMLCGIVACYFLIPDVQKFLNEAWSVLISDDNKRIEQWVDGFGWYGPLVIILTMCIQMFLLIVPTVALMVVTIVAYGPIYGSIIIILSIYAASSVGYFIGRYLSQTFIMKLLGQSTEHKIERLIENYGFWAVVVTRLNPFLSNDAISFVGGMLKMGYWQFIGATLVGILPLTLFIAILGRSTDQLQSGFLWGSIVSLIVFGLYVWWDQSKKD